MPFCWSCRAGGRAARLGVLDERAASEPLVDRPVVRHGDVTWPQLRRGKLADVGIEPTPLIVR